MTEAQTESDNPALEEAARELQAASHDAQVAYDCIALGDIDRAHTHALTAKVAAEAAMTALAAAMANPALLHAVNYFTFVVDSRIRSSTACDPLVALFLRRGCAPSGTAHRRNGRLAGRLGRHHAPHRRATAGEL